jgi:hypothetical protein
MFASTKCKANLPLGSEANSHQHDRMNFSRLKMANAMALFDQLSAVDVGEGNIANLVVTYNGAEVLECLYGDDIGELNIVPLNQIVITQHCKKNIKHYCKATIISKQIDHGSPTFYYVGY